MYQVINDRINVHQRGERSHAFTWGGRYYRIQEILDQWFEPDEWWASRPMRHFARLHAACGDLCGTFEIYRRGDA